MRNQKYKRGRVKDETFRQMEINCYQQKKGLLFLWDILCKSHGNYKKLQQKHIHKREWTNHHEKSPTYKSEKENNEETK